MTKVIFIGDPHFQISNIQEVNIFLERITALCEQTKPDIIVIAGDTLHTHERLHTVPLNKAYDLVNRMRTIAPTYVLVGNHDYQNNSQFLSDNHWLSGMKEWSNTYIVDRVLSLMINNQKFIFVPYVSPQRFEEALNTIDDYWRDANCIFCHQEFFGCKMGHIISTQGDKWDLSYPEIISGHIHSNQSPQKNIYYPGSAMQIAFGESEQNIIPILTFNDDLTYDKEEIDLKLPRKRIIYMDIDSVVDYVIPVEDEIEEHLRDKIKITVTGLYDEFKAFKKTNKYKEIINYGIKIVFKPKIETDDENSKDSNENADKLQNNIYNFNSILTDLIMDQKNPYLIQAYDLIVNNNKMQMDDIMFL